MKRMRVFILLLMVFLLCVAFPASAELLVIGTASYDSDEDGVSEEYKLIHMTDGPFGAVTWLDYTRSKDNWWNQMDWARGLGEYLTINPYPGYEHITDTLLSSGWRLPLVDESMANLNAYTSHGYEGPDEDGYHDYEWGYNMINGEMGYLYYEELGNTGAFAKDGTTFRLGWAIKNNGDFENLRGYYWSGTEHSEATVMAWEFDWGDGSQSDDNKENYNRSQAMAVNAVPEPTTFMLVGAGLVGLGAWRNKFRRRFR